MEAPHKYKLSFDPDDMPNWLSKLEQNKLFLKNVIAGINQDDCGIIKVGKEQIVVTTDFLNAKPIALELGIGGPWDLGRLLVAANISDLCGTGAAPQAFLVSIMIKTNEDSENYYKKFMRGVIHELKKYKIPLLGGDSKLGDSNTFCGMALGIKEKKTKLFIKNSAKANDSVWVSGKIGGVAAAIDGLNAKDMDKKWNQWAKKRIIDPKVPLEKSKILAKSKLANGGVDLSDGLGSDLWDLCQASNLGAEIDVDLIPLSKNVRVVASKRNIFPWIYAITVGGDFQFLVTSNARNDVTLTKMGFVKIGKLIKEREAYMIHENIKFKLPKLGHRDTRRETFVNEVQILVDNIKNVLDHD
jgi:thiamine-monophosphate kinase